MQELSSPLEMLVYYLRWATGAPVLPSCYAWYSIRLDITAITHGNSFLKNNSQSTLSHGWTDAAKDRDHRVAHRVPYSYTMRSGTWLFPIHRLNTFTAWVVSTVDFHGKLTFKTLWWTGRVPKSLRVTLWCWRSVLYIAASGRGKMYMI